MLLLKGKQKDGAGETIDFVEVRGKKVKCSETDINELLAWRVLNESNLRHPMATFLWSIIDREMLNVLHKRCIRRIKVEYMKDESKRRREAPVDTSLDVHVETIETETTPTTMVSEPTYMPSSSTHATSAAATSRPQ
uniref:Integrase core domain containing protein n=1 Tax=Solanum tuberosum TaxID=4113 RepID=M1DK99_SOLTU